MRLLIVLGLILLLGSCFSANREPGYVYFWLESNPTTLDPALVVDYNGGIIAAKLFNGLVRLGPKLEIIPDIAESWEVSTNGLAYTFKLREGVRFSSGRSVRAQDFKYSFERVLDPATKSPNTWIFEKIKGVGEFMDGQEEAVSGIEVIDEHTLIIKLSKPFSPFLNLLTMPAAYVIPFEEVLHQGADFSSNPVGTGPYVLKEWIPSQSMELERSVHYFNEMAKVEGIIYRIIPEALTAVMEFELGNLDVIKVPGSAYDRYRRSISWKPLLTAEESLNTYYLGLNCAREPFSDPEVRRAMNMAIDRDKILRTMYQGRGILAQGPVPGILRNWNSPAGYDYDPDEAKSVFREKGLLGEELQFYVKADQQNVDIAEVIQAYLIEAGLNISIRPLEWSAYKEAINNGEADLFWLSWWADYSDPENFLFPLFHSSNHGSGGNRVRYDNKELDGFIEMG
ncbi:ABC transporter substrate-binding protein, partial [Nitrospirota bacterium]